MKIHRSLYETPVSDRRRWLDRHGLNGALNLSRRWLRLRLGFRNIGIGVSHGLGRTVGHTFARFSELAP